MATNSPPRSEVLAALLYRMRHNLWQSEEDAVRVYAEIDEALQYYDPSSNAFTVPDSTTVQEGYIRMPQTVEEAQAMVRVGAAYLSDRLKALLNSAPNTLPPMPPRAAYQGPERRRVARN